MTHAERIRANVRAILAAGRRAGRGARAWPPVYPDTTNGVRFAAGRDAFGCRAPGAAALWWSEFRTQPSGRGVIQVRRGLWAPGQRQQMKAEAFNLITQAGRLAAR